MVVVSIEEKQKHSSTRVEENNPSKEPKVAVKYPLSEGFTFPEKFQNI